MVGKKQSFLIVRAAWVRLFVARSRQFCAWRDTDVLSRGISVSKTCEWALLKRLSKSDVKGQGHKESQEHFCGGGIHFDGAASRTTCLDIVFLNATCGVSDTNSNCRSWSARTRLWKTDSRLPTITSSPSATVDCSSRSRWKSRSWAYSACSGNWRPLAEHTPTRSVSTVALKLWNVRDLSPTYA